MNKILSKPFLTSLFIKQNRWHKHSVLGHTLSVTFHAIKSGQFRFIVPALLHDIGKPFVAHQRNPKDVVSGTYSFTNHEEMSWHIIKNCPFISDWTKDIIRHHYLLRDMYLSEQKGLVARGRRVTRRWEKLTPELKKDLEIFLAIDDAGKK
jgi:predicted HD phosphohydrolase